jgi:hypothetical protein
MSHEPPVANGFATLSEYVAESSPHCSTRRSQAGISSRNRWPWLVGACSIETAALNSSSAMLRAWFRIWVGTSDGLVRRADMRAEGHIMNQTYADLNGPVIVQTP